MPTVEAMAAMGTLGVAMVNDCLRHRRGAAEMDALFVRLVNRTHHTLPDPPVSAAARFSALPPDDAVDRVSLLPDALLRNIVSLLPVKDAARTAALSRRWRGVWRSAPLVLADADLSPAASALSRVLDAHPGPFRSVHLTSSCTQESRGQLTRWLQLLAAKGVQELVLVSHLCPLDAVLPAAFFGMATLTRLHLGLWKFPDTASLPLAGAVSFPNLRELGLCSVFVESRDLDFILDRSPALETLRVEGNLFTLRLRLVSHSLRCVQIIGSFFEEIFVVKAPRLERLIDLDGWTPASSCTKVKIGHAPKLHLLAYLKLDPGSYVLEVGNTTIKAGTRMSPRTMVPSVKILALEVRFGVRNDAKMIPSVFRCFPSVETLHIKSGKPDQSTGKLNVKFWHESGAIECIRTRISLLVFHDFQVGRSELAFLKCLFESALVLKKVVILLSAGSASVQEVHSKVSSLRSMKQGASETTIVLVTGCSESDPQGGEHILSFKRGSDFSLRDPLANY